MQKYQPSLPNVTEEGQKLYLQDQVMSFLAKKIHECTLKKLLELEPQLEAQVVAQDAELQKSIISHYMYSNFSVFFSSMKMLAPFVIEFFRHHCDRGKMHVTKEDITDYVVFFQVHYSLLTTDEVAIDMFKK
jgi:hypothetical protein